MVVALCDSRRTYSHLELVGSAAAAISQVATAIATGKVNDVHVVA